jgi:DNA replication protein DnaC
MAAANTLMRTKGGSAFYVHTSSLMNDIEYYRNNRDQMTRCDLLILDDLGHHNVSDYTINLLFAILNDRLAGNYGIMIISNFSRASFIERVLAKGIEAETVNAVRDRLLAMCDPIEVVSENVRKSRSLERKKAAKK